MNFDIQTAGKTGKSYLTKTPFLLGLGLVGVVALVTLMKKNSSQVQTVTTDEGVKDAGTYQAYSSEDVNSMFQYFDNNIASQQDMISTLQTENVNQQTIIDELKNAKDNQVQNQETQEVTPVTTTPTPVQQAPVQQAPAQEYVTVGKWTSRNTAWNSTLWGIANRYGTTVDNLMALNPNITNRNLIYPNQQVRVK